MTPLSPELTYLVWSVILCLAQMGVAAALTTRQLGVELLAGNRESVPPASGIAGRAQRAHRNMLENLPLFAALVLTAQVTGHLNDMTLLGAQLFFYGRLAFAAVYLAGIVYLRTAVWAVGLLGLVLIFLQLI